MKRRTSVMVAAVVVAFLVGGALAYGQGISAEIGFPFVAAGKELAAGKYNVSVTANGEVSLTGSDRRTLLMPVITRLGRHDRDTDPEFVFDKIDGKLLLSEIWMPGKDGLLVLATKEPHEHAVSGGSNPRK
jgi:hypothetical protein